MILAIDHRQTNRATNQGRAGPQPSRGLFVAANPAPSSAVYRADLAEVN
jgi:hypothetical protein